MMPKNNVTGSGLASTSAEPSRLRGKASAGMETPMCRRASLCRLRRLVPSFWSFSQPLRVRSSAELSRLFRSSLQATARLIKRSKILMRSQRDALSNGIEQGCSAYLICTWLSSCWKRGVWASPAARILGDSAVGEPPAAALTRTSPLPERTAGVFGGTCNAVGVLPGLGFVCTQVSQHYSLSINSW